MEWRIERDSDSQAAVFAAEELAKYLRKMDARIDVAILKSSAARFNGALRLEVGDVTSQSVSDPGLDDAYAIDVKDGAGVITGSNERSVLLGVYRFLRELGCRWPRPGEDGEIIPRRSLSECAVKLSDRASYRHRGVCIEGACSFRHVMNMVDWLPKVGMNSYFCQFSTPYAFFDYWYSHKSNPYMEPQSASVEEVTAMVGVIAAEVKKRGMLYHATGHGWTCDPVGIPGNSWERAEYDIPEDVRELLALVDGKREVYGGVALNTNLCYSNPAAREKIIAAIVDYCRAKREVDYLHFWLADAPNNHCECENCRGTSPSDFYVMMLNEIDRRLGAESIPTKIVFLVYFDLLWEPQTERLKNHDRFTLMFAPITRTYSKSFADDAGEAPELVPYVRNKLTLPKSVGENVARLRRWQAQYSGDGFDFDYHLYRDHTYDLGGVGTARVMFEDMKNLDKLGLNGMMSCQVQRAFFPAGLTVNAMAAALWDKSRDFEDVAGSLFGDIFGEYAGEMYEYFSRLSELFQAPYLRGERPAVDTGAAGKFAEIPKIVNAMLPRILVRYESAAGAFDRRTWSALIVHAQLCIYVAAALEARAKGDSATAAEKWDAAADYVNRMEPGIHELFDVKYFTDVVGRVFRGRLQFE